MDRIGVGKWRCPQAFAPLHGECLRQFFSRESQSLGTAISVDELQVSEFMQEHVIEDETPDCKQRPFLTTLGAELPGVWPSTRAHVRPMRGGSAQRAISRLLRFT